jgi:hypothetical protein
LIETTKAIRKRMAFVLGLRDWRRLSSHFASRQADATILRNAL